MGTEVVYRGSVNDSEPLQFNYRVPCPPDGRVVELTDDQMERLLVKELQEAKADPTQPMWKLAIFYRSQGNLDRALALFRDLLLRVPDLESKAQLIFSLGQTAEKASDFDLAVRFYREALGMEPCSPFTWYFIHNNLGYSLNQLGRYGEGADYCRRAITISQQPPNGHKNLGLALTGLGRYREAAEAFIRATQANASDARSLRHLEALLSEHPELEFEFSKAVAACREAVAVAREAIEEAEAGWMTAAKQKKRS